MKKMINKILAIIFTIIDLKESEKNDIQKWNL